MATLNTQMSSGWDVCPSPEKTQWVHVTRKEITAGNWRTKPNRKRNYHPVLLTRGMMGCLSIQTYPSLAIHHD